MNCELSDPLEREREQAGSRVVVWERACDLYNVIILPFASQLARLTSRWPRHVSLSFFFFPPPPFFTNLPLNNSFKRVWDLSLLLFFLFFELLLLYVACTIFLLLYFEHTFTCWPMGNGYGYGERVKFSNHSLNLSPIKGLYSLYGLRERANIKLIHLY